MQKKMNMAKERNDEFTFTWKIENFSMCNKMSGQRLESPTFLVNCLNESKCCISLYPKGWSECCRNYLSCFLDIVDLKTEDITLYLKLELIGLNGKILVSKECSYIFNKDCNKSGFDELIELEELHSNMSEDILTIACYMKRLDNWHPTGCTALTKMCADKFSFHWSVCNCDYEDFGSDSEWTESKVFTFHERCSIEIELSALSDEMIVTTLSLDEINAELFSPKVVKCRITLLDTKGIERESKESSHLFVSKEDIWEFPSFIKKSQIREEKNDFLKNGIFVLKLEFSISTGKYSDEIEYNFENSAELSYSSDFHSLHEDFRNLYNSKDHSDIKLKVKDNVFFVHKTVLVARSKVFSAMFDQDMLETQNGVIEIKDTDEETVEHFLTFMYTNRIDVLDYKAVLKLFMVADKYQVLSLVKKCAELLTASLTNINVCEILVAADLVEDKILKSAAINFIRKHFK